MKVSLALMDPIRIVDLITSSNHDCCQDKQGKSEAQIAREHTHLYVVWCKGR